MRRSTLCAHFATECICIDVIDEGALAVDLDDRQPLPESRLEVGIAADVDLLELERNVGADALEHAAGALAEVAALRVVENDATDRCRG